jgi:hypothetical protein
MANVIVLANKLKCACCEKKKEDILMSKASKSSKVQH